MPYLKPNAFTAKVFNRVVRATGAFGTTTLTVAGRTTGDLHSVPVNTVDVGGRTYLVSTRGESQWVKNVRAAGRITLTRAGKNAAYAVRELPVTERAPVIAAYREELGKVVSGYWTKLPDDVDHPVFELRSPGGSW